MKKNLFIISLLLITFIFVGCSLVPQNKQITHYSHNKDFDNYSKHFKEYYKLIAPITAKNLIYPKDALILGQEGTTIVQFIINKSKKISNLKIHKSSGFSKLDKCALDTIIKASKNFPSPPKNFKIILHVNFTINKDI